MEYHRFWALRWICMQVGQGWSCRQAEFQSTVGDFIPKGLWFEKVEAHRGGKLGKKGYSGAGTFWAGVWGWELTALLERFDL